MQDQCNPTAFYQSEASRLLIWCDRTKRDAQIIFGFPFCERASPWYELKMFNSDLEVIRSRRVHTQITGVSLQMITFKKHVSASCFDLMISTGE